MKTIRRIFLILTVLAPFTGVVSSASWAETKLEATIFTYDGKDFVRAKTTLNAEGESATNTKLEHGNPAYNALVKKHSYSGSVSLFGREYDANYAPLISEDGKLTGAVFVGVPK